MLWSHSCNFFWNQIFFICKKKQGSCPFGLIKRLDPVVVIFSKNIKKFTSVGSSAFQKNLQRLDQPTLMGSKNHLHPIVVFFFEINFFSFPKKSVGWSNRCKFFWNALDPIFVIFLTFFEKNYNDWIKSFYKSKWTGLL